MDMAGQKWRQSTKLPHVCLKKFVERAIVRKTSIESLQKLLKSATKCNFNFYFLILFILVLYFISSFCLRLKEIVLTEPQMSAESESEKTRFSAKSLRAHEMARGMTPSVYDCVSVTGPPHNRFFTMTCKQGEHITRGKLMWTYNIIPKKNTE